MNCEKSVAPKKESVVLETVTKGTVETEPTSDCTEKPESIVDPESDSMPVCGSNHHMGVTPEAKVPDA